MITYDVLLQAVLRVNGWRGDMQDAPLVGQLAQSLELYKARGEFDGTLHSALECLTLACYEFESKCYDGVRMERRGYE